MPDVVICADCEFENPEGHRFCGSCGASLTPAVDRRRLVTSVFCDLSGSTELAERLDAESVFELMRSYYDAARGALERHGGAVEKFIGDAVVGMFGVSQANEDDALRACRAALEIQERLAELEEWQQAGMEVRIGVNTGEVVAGDASRREMFASGDAVVLGDSVNVAARLEQAAAPGEILVGEATYRLVWDAVSVEPVPPVEAKGKTKPLICFRLLGVSTSGRSERAAAGALVGRASELVLLERELERAVSGGCRLVTVVGEPGVGKSRLSAELLEGAAGRVRAVQGACLSYGEGITYWPLMRVVRELAGIGDEESLQEARARLDAFVEGVPEGAAVADQVAQLLGLGEGGTTWEELAWAVRRFLAAAAVEKPLVVVFDDIHWAEPALLDLIAGLPEALADTQVLILCLARPELHERAPDWPVTLAVEPLGEDAADALLASLGVPEAVRPRLARTGAGNPLFAEELVGMLVAEGVLVAEEDALVLQGELDRIELPATLNALLSARLDRLDAEQRDALERGSVEGELFHRDAVVELSEENARATVPIELTELSRKDLIRLTAASFAGELVAYKFKHILVRDAAYRATTKKLRSTLHERYGDWLEQRAGDRLGEFQEILGYHLEQAHRYRSELGLKDDHTRALGERAAVHLGTAGLRAATRGDAPATANLLDRALALGIPDLRERLRLQIDLAVAFGQIGRNEEGLAVLAETHDRAVASGEHALAAYAAVQRVWTRTGDPTLDFADAAVIAARAIPALSGAGDERDLAYAVRLHGFALGSSAGQTPEVGAELERAIAHARASGDTRALREAIRTFTGTYLSHGPTPAVEAITRCEELLGSARDDRVLEATIKQPLALFYAMAGRPADAEERLGEALLVYDELPDTRFKYLYRWIVADTRVLLGNPAEAEEQLLRIWRFFRDFQGKTVDTRAVNTALSLARFYCDQRRFDDAARMIAYGPEAQVGWRAPHRFAVQARLAAHEGRLDEAIALGERAVERAETLPYNLERRAGIWASLATVLDISGRSSAAESARATAFELYERKGNIAAAARLRALAHNPA